ncbi:glycoside hydrolase family 2 [Paenibacillus sp. HWE-109]|uniref:glycoside hydrolase family 2 protein n=1 Tax=Paenibacillus sp. HWE-109 TaxID=1306526 RepID=UPI001EE0E011|nr:sugar-binding domain-containing protein [Paenibacillus sp. HWE-109]UKS25386.1 glycoside hydrolase family 2 [Paenibacillus sp. HWE-109]
MTSHSYIPNYPRPQFVREAWTDLNGTWSFCFDDLNAGVGEKWFEQLPAAQTITVPFTYETEASGINDPVFHPYVWYERSISLPKDQQNKRTILHFQAVDHHAQVWVNGQSVGEHTGGYAAFQFDITDYIDVSGENRIVVRAQDSDNCMQPRGKQRWVKDNFGCWYVQTTGIWQSVWLEYVAPQYVKSVKMTPDIDKHQLNIQYQLQGVEQQEGLLLKTIVRFEGQLIKESYLAVDRAKLSADIHLYSDRIGEWKIKHWHPNHPNLYDIEFVLLKDGEPLDRVNSYFGFRKVSIEKGKVLINNMPYYQKLLLDQGYWKETHLTPPSEEALIEDIEKTMALGFNGVRKHQKLEDPRFLYWCDRKGLLVWSEMGAAYEFGDEAVESFTREWMEVVQQHYNHPCIVTWVPFNESWGVPNIKVDRTQQQFTEAIYYLTKSFDPMRPVIVNDGWEHTVSDIITLHDYEELGQIFYERYQDKDLLLSNDIIHNDFKFPFADGYAYKGQPVIISEYGGIAFTTEEGWGYGNQVKTEEEFLTRYRNITQAIRDLDYVCGYCYTQLTDVQQELNGLLTIEREPKIALEKIREITKL